MQTARDCQRKLALLDGVNISSWTTHDLVTSARLQS